MLLTFSATNHLSLKNEVELSLVAAKLRDFSEGLLETSVSGIDALPSALIYGPNASGKSNILLALMRMASIVVNSQTKSRPDSNIPRSPFLLDPQSRNEPTRFEVDFLVDRVRYNYGFSYVDEEIEREWLLSYPNGREVNLFTRNGQDFNFGRKLRGRNVVIGELTRKNSLFLSAAAQSDHQELTQVYKFFADITFINSIAIAGYAASLELQNGAIDERVINFLRNIGTGVVSYQKTKEPPLSDFKRDLAQSVLSAVRKHAEDVSDVPFEVPQNDLVELGHAATDGSTVFFELDRESSGTRRLLVMLSSIFKVLDEGGLIIIDELDASLHTQACELIFALFSNKEYNLGGAQLIATVHDTNLLSSEFIRRDQIWLCEKDEVGVSNVRPLSDIQLRATDDFEKGYLQGRFHALPLQTSVEQTLANGKIISK